MNVNPDVLKHINKFDQSIQDRFMLIRDRIINKIPNVIEKLGYGVPGYYHEKKNVVYLACFKGHIGIYPGKEAIIHFKKDLENYKTSDGTIRIEHTQEIPLVLIEKILAFKGFK